MAKKKGGIKKQKKGTNRIDAQIGGMFSQNNKRYNSYRLKAHVAAVIDPRFNTV